MRSYENGFLIHEQLSAIMFISLCDRPCATCLEVQPAKCLSCYSNPAISPAIYWYNSSCYEVCPPSTYILSVNGSQILQCGDCSSNCLQCVNSDTYCTACNVAPSIHLYLLVNATDNTSVCVDVCPPTTFLSSLECLDCVEPCFECVNTSTTCTVCLSTYYTYIDNNTVNCVS